MRKFLSTIEILAVICGTALFGETAFATTYDAQASLAAAAVPGSPYNTAGQFSLGTYTTPLTPSTFALFNNADFNDNVAGTGMDYIKNGGSDPNIIFNDSGNTQSIAGFTLAPDQIAAGPFQGPAVIRFTAPTTGDYTISSFFADIQNVNSAPTGEVFHDNVLLGSGVATTGTGYSYTNGGLYLLAGDTVDFVTDSLGNAHNASTLVEATLNLVPEPSSIVALGGLGIMGLFLIARRRRKS